MTAPPNGRRSLSTFLLWAGTWLMVGLFLYALPPLAILLDESVLKTRWIYKHMPDGLTELYCKIYPLMCHSYGH